MSEPLPHDRLPLPDYDHLTVGALPGQIASLSSAEVQQLLDYERRHGDRIAVTLVLEHRIEALENGAAVSSGTRPSGGSPATNVAPPGGSPVTAATSGPVINPPSHGDPTNPAQPR